MNLRMSLACLVLFGTGTVAFDGKREGFILGAAIGGHYGIIDETDFYVENYDATDRKFGLAADFLLGYSMDWLAIHGGIGRTTYLSDKETEEELNSGFEKTPKKLLLIGVGANLYLMTRQQLSLNPYVSFRWGTLIHEEEREDSDLYMGRATGWAGGIGVEFLKYLAIETRFLSGRPVETDRKLDVSSYQLLIVGLLY